MTAQGVVTRPSSHGVGPSIDRLEALLKARGVTIFARIDHGAGAAQAGLSMRASQVLVFGNPRSICHSRRSPGRTATVARGSATTTRIIWRCALD
jgi:hypothetical protein